MLMHPPKIWIVISLIGILIIYLILGMGFVDVDVIMEITGLKSTQNVTKLIADKQIETMFCKRLTIDGATISAIGGENPELAFDGNFKTAWFATGPGSRLQVRLNKPADIEIINVQYTGGYFTIKISSDGTHWEIIPKDPRDWQIKLCPIRKKVRYIRFERGGSQPSMGFESVAEVQIYGYNKY